MTRSLDQIIEKRGQPKVIRCDNGPEHISHTLLPCTQKRNIRTEHIQPGELRQNTCVQRCNRTVRYGRLNQELFESIGQVQD